ncbi:MAG TPA: hypothetical protein VIG98_05785 [Bacillus sp. (in: firmicutes)]
MTKEELTDQVANGKAEVGAILLENDFQILVGVDSPNVNMLKQTIQEAYISRDQRERILQAANAESNLENEKVSAELETAMGDPIFNIEKRNFKVQIHSFMIQPFNLYSALPCFLSSIPLPTMYYPFYLKKVKGFGIV